jgi:diguanylate cyclase (GGDEF)-like protein/PAS domain S-box-containing protein
VGTLCLFDPTPKKLSLQERDSLSQLANWVEAEFKQTYIEQTETRLGVILDAVIEAIITLDDQGNIESFNNAATHIFGYEAEEVIGNNVKILIPEPYHQENDDCIQNFLETRKAVVIGKRIEVIGRRKDATTFPMELSVTESVVSGSRFFTGIARDITEQKRAEQSALKSEIKHDLERLQLKALITTIPDLVWLKDVNGVFLNCNSRVESLFGAKVEDILGKTDYDFFDKELADFFRLHDKAAMESSSPLINEEQITFIDGHTELIETTKTAMFDQGGNIIGVLGVGHNITERKQDELALEEKIKLKTSELKESQAHLTFAIEGVGDGIWDWDLDTNQVKYSKGWKGMLGYAENEVKDDFSEWQRLVHPDDIDGALSRVDEFLKNKTKKYESEFRMQHKDGRYINILARAFATEGRTGKIIRLLGTHSDITKRKLTEEKLKLAASVFSHAREGITVTDATGKIIEVNDTFTDITGYSREEAIGQSPRMLDSPDRQPPEFYTAMWQKINTTGYWTGEIWNQRKNGEIYPVMLTKSAVKDSAGKVTHYVAHFSDITRQKDHQNQLEQMAHYDVLTGLPNRTLLADRLNQAILQSQRHHNALAVVFLDLDGFKDVNDTYGHDVGDELLIILSLRMKETLREGDTLARMGGDEFVAVLAGLADVEDSLPVLDRLLLATSEPIRVGDVVIHISASIGVTLYPNDGVDADMLMRHADQAMYLAKKAGKNCYHLFDTAHDAAVSNQRESLDNISAALDRREFVLYYQPKVNMSTGKIVGVEALIRWQHPVRGLVPPLDFLPILDGHAISLAIGEWVINTALSQISQWQSLGLTLPISVNISGHQLQQIDFVTRLEALLAKHPDVSPHHFELEVLETSILTDINHISTTMDACRELGVQFALDDFGTGYSSLTHLRRLPASLIKIDQSFVRDMLVDPDDLAIIEGVISLAKAFQRDVIAEGVETIKHGTTLLQLGCKLAQGYGIARPMPASDIPEWVKGWKPDDAWLRVNVK